MAERILEAALAMRAPGHLVVGDLRSGRGTGGQGARDEAVRVVEEDLDARAGHAAPARAGLGRVVRVGFVQEEGGAAGLQPGHATEVP